MAELTLVILAAVITALVILRTRPGHVRDVVTSSENTRIKRLWEYAETAIRRNALPAAEKALLQILKYDQKNTSAYNRLGMLYVKQKDYQDAVSCFDIASSLAPSVASLYNLGLVHYQSGNLDKAALSLEKVIDLEPTPKRLLVFARIQQQLGNHRRVIEAVKRAVELDPNQRNLAYLADAYDQAKQYQKAEQIRRQMVADVVN